MSQLSCKDAVAVVLAESDEPMHYGEITSRILDRGLWSTNGKTPDATVNAQLATEISKHGENSQFIRTAPGIFALRTSGLDPYTPPSRSNASGPMTYLQAAEAVLSGQDEPEPMHYKAITQAALDQALLDPQGLTPEATMYAQIVTHVNKAEDRGEVPTFTKLGKGMVGLTEWLGVGAMCQVRQHNDEVRQQLRDAIENMEPDEFEDFVGRVLSEIGFDEIDVTKYHGDKGIDVRGTLVVAGGLDVEMAVQVKKWKNPVQAPEVQKVRGAASANERGLIVTTSSFSTGARAEAGRAGFAPVGLIDGDELIGLMLEHNIGVRRTEISVFEFDPEAL